MTRPFDRWKPLWERTWAFRRFKQHHTELNYMLWSRVPLNGIAHFKLKAANSKEDVRPLLHVDLTHPDAYRIPRTVDTWKSAFAESENWVRLCCLMSALAYLELYVASVVRLSLASNPGILIGASKAVDGVIVLKKHIPLATTEAEIASTRGEWSARHSYLEKRFAVSLPKIQANISELDRMRVLRNSIGHFFGRDEQSIGVGVISHINQRIERVSEKALRRCLGLVMDTAEEFEEHIAAPNIGDFELLLCVHHLKTGKRPEVKGNWFVQGEPVKTLKRLLGTIQQPAPSNDYCQDAISHYDAL